MNWFLLTYFGLTTYNPTFGLELGEQFTDRLRESIKVEMVLNSPVQTNVAVGADYMIFDDLYIGADLGVFRKHTDKQTDHSNFYYGLNISYDFNDLYSIEAGVTNECYIEHIRPSWDRMKPMITFKMKIF